MNRRGLVAAAVAVTLVAAPAMAQRWQQLPGAPNATLSVDITSIKPEGPWRVFRTRTTSVGMPGTIYGVMAMNCKAGIAELRSQRVVHQGQTVRERVHPVGKRPRQRIANPARDPAFRLVCAPLRK